MSSNKIAVVAIGGNFLSDGKSVLEEQMIRASRAAGLVELLVKRGFHVVVVHGNGPQVGTSYLRQLTGAKENLPPMSLAMCDAASQAEIGTILELAIINKLNKTTPDFSVLTIVSQVEVKADDPAFSMPTKPIGPFYTRAEAEALREKFPEWTIVEEHGRGYRRLVPSPNPVKVFSTACLKDAFNTARVVITGGGGGIPVVRKPDNTFELIDGVIDKDRTACLIALATNASHFFLLTGVSQVCVNFGKSNEKALKKVPVSELKTYYDEGQFPPGSMGPKVEAAVKFVEETHGFAVITNADNLANSLNGTEGTIIHA